ncbi:MAG: hypothetical protein KF768_01585 [Phycisphaeraceae bacterium]|nr:hypothetical protein [Phycisphaeraceae bacterium]
MSITLIIGVTAFVVVVGGVIALMWFRLAAKAAPYRDEIERRQSAARGDRAGTGTGTAGGAGERVIVIDDAHDRRR